MKVLLVDPALFTGPYDAALTEGLAAAGVTARWVSRPLRPGERTELAPELVEPLFYRRSAASVRGAGLVPKLRKAIDHVLGGVRLAAYARAGGFDVVHLQWAVAPAFDALVMIRLARSRPVLLTVHDLQPFNGSPTSRLQTLSFDRVLRAASHLIVHSDAARAALLARGHDASRVSVVPHGPLELGRPAPSRRPGEGGGPWRVVLFGRLQPYKGVDLLVEAVARLGPADRARLRVEIAGEPLMPLEPVIARIAEAGLEDVVELRPGRLDEEAMARLFERADTFVFPYRAIDASGVYHLVRRLGRWVVASDLGAFSDLRRGVEGQTTPPGDPEALAAALVDSIGRVPAAGGDAGPGWEEIGVRTRQVYERALAQRRAAAR